MLVRNIKGSIADNRQQKGVSFTSNSPPVYAVKNSNILKKGLPTIAFLSSLTASIAYLFGSAGLFYDIHKSGGIKNNPKKEGVDTIEGNTKIGKIAINAGKMAVFCTSIGGIACGLGEGFPLMAIGEATNLSSASIINTPLGTGLFGIGIASIFASLALENTPELKLNEFEIMAEKNTAKKTQMILKNIGVIAKEISSSIFQMTGNLFKKGFIKDNIIQGTPKTVVFKEEINKDGKVIFSKMLRHNKNYIMHAASFVLALGGGGLVLSSIFNNKKVQKATLKIEEGGFLFDNFGITRYGFDKLTTNGKSAGLSFAIGGIINAISQFVGLDNKDGRALQWLGISGVFLGYSIDRGKHLRQALKYTKQRPELTQTVREWRFNLSNLVKDKTELKKLQKEIKMGQTITNKRFVDLENKFKTTIGTDYVPTEKMKKELENHLGKEIFANVKVQEVDDFEGTKKVLQICTEKIFGSKNPKPIN